MLLGIRGEPAPKGSVSAFVVKSKGHSRAVVTHTSKSKAWEKIIREALTGGPIIPDGPLAITLWFYLTKSKSTKYDVPWVRPDVDKLVRAVLDALQGKRNEQGMIVDDSRIVDLHAYKRYATEQHPSGVIIEIVEGFDAD